MLVQRSALILVQLLLLITLLVANIGAELTLEKLCKSKSNGNWNKDNFELTRISQLEKIAADLETSSSLECPESIRGAILELRNLVAAGEPKGESDHVCGARKVDEIAKFNENYIRPDEIGLPKVLMNFFLAYAFRVSKVCKKNMINSLTFDSKHLLREKDFELVGKLVSDNSTLAGLLDDPQDYDDLILPQELLQALFGEEKRNKELNGVDDDDTLAIKSITNSLIKRVQFVCKRRFRPIYSQLIVPIVRLSNMGFNYRGEDLAIELREMAANEEVHQWYRIVYICETLLHIELVEDPQFEAQQDQRVVRLLSREERDQLRASGEIGASSSEMETSLEREFPEVQYEPDYGISLEDQLIEREDKEFLKLIGKFEAHKQELERIRERIFKKVSQFIVANLKRGSFRVIGSMFKKGGQMDGNQELVRELDSYVAEQRASSGHDQPVSGLSSKLGGVGRRYYNTVTYKGIGGLAAGAATNAKQHSVKRWFWYSLSAFIFILAISVLACAG